MVSLFTSYEIANDIDFANTIKDALLVVDDLEFAFGEISRDFFKSNKATFSNAQGQYPPLKEKYQKQKDKKYGRQPILVASGALRDSLTDKPNENSIVGIGKRSLMLGTKLPYGPHLQFGTNKMPMRKFLFIGPEAGRFGTSRTVGRLQRWVSIIETDVDRRLKKL